VEKTYGGWGNKFSTNLSIIDVLPLFGYTHTVFLK
jgi:hypothetical protein